MLEIKKELRKQLIERRKLMSPDLKQAADISIFEQLKPFIDKAGSVFAYASTPIEVDTRRLISYCLETNKPVALPKSGESELSFYFINSSAELSKGRYGIDEPPEAFPAVDDSNTLCIVPALCADGNGFRLGYGKGYYDRFLNGFNGQSVILCYSEFKRDVPTEPHDVKADFTIFDEL